MNFPLLAVMPSLYPAVECCDCNLGISDRSWRCDVERESARASVFVSESRERQEGRGGEAEKISSKISFVVTSLTAVMGIGAGAGEDENEDGVSINILGRL